MQQVDEHLECLLDNPVRSLSFDVHDKPHPARIVLVRGVVKPLGRRQSWDFHTTVIRHSGAISKRNLQMPSMRSASVLIMRSMHGWHLSAESHRDPLTMTLVGIRDPECPTAGTIIGSRIPDNGSRRFALCRCVIPAHRRFDSLGGGRIVK
jgi:hypothetical protein